MFNGTSGVWALIERDSRGEYEDRVFLYETREDALVQQEISTRKNSKRYSYSVAEATFDT